MIGPPLPPHEDLFFRPEPKSVKIRGASDQYKGITVYGFEDLKSKARKSFGISQMERVRLFVDDEDAVEIEDEEYYKSLKDGVMFRVLSETEARLEGIPDSERIIKEREENRR